MIIFHFYTIIKFRLSFRRRRKELVINTFSQDSAGIWFDFDSVDQDSKLIGIFEVEDGGVYDKAIYIQVDKTFLFSEYCFSYNFVSTEGFIVVTGSDTVGGDNWDDFRFRVRIYDDDNSYTCSGDAQIWIGDENSNRLRFIVYRYSFTSSTPQVDIAAMYTWGNVWENCYPDANSWDGIQNHVSDFWVEKDNFNEGFTSLGLASWSWPNPY